MRAWKYIGASVAGKSHIEKGTPCQDSSVVATCADGNILVAIVSDGAGSARHSEIGSRLVCHTILEEITNYVQSGGAIGDLRETIIDSWIESAVYRLTIQARAMEVETRDLAATVVGALIGADGSAFFQIGDGAIVVLGDGEYTAVTWPENGDYANVTYFITDDRALEHLDVHIQKSSYDEVALFTDGLQMLVLDFQRRQAHSPFFRPLFSRLRAESAGSSSALTSLLEEYLVSSTVNKRTDDDKSLVLATRLSADESGVMSVAVTPTSGGHVLDPQTPKPEEI